MIFSLVPVLNVTNAAENERYSDFYVCGYGDNENAFNNGAGIERKRENKMIEVSPNVYELTVLNVLNDSSAACYFTNGKDYYGDLSGDGYAKYFSSIPEEKDCFHFSVTSTISDIKYYLYISESSVTFNVKIISSTHHHELN